MYSEADLLRLHQIVVGRSLGLALEEIRRTLDDPEDDTRAPAFEPLAWATQKARALKRLIEFALSALTPVNSGSLA